MCKVGNQTIYRECLEELRKQLKNHFTNQAARELLRKHGGCMVVRHREVSAEQVVDKGLEMCKT